MRRLLVVSSDPVVAAELAAVGVEVVPDGPAAGLNAALRARRRAAAQRATRTRAVGALQADLPALRPAELRRARSARAAAAVRRRRAPRAFCADAAGTGTTLLLAAPGTPLRPALRGRLGAPAPRVRGASRCVGDWPGLRRDVDTGDDLRAAAELGLGAHTRARAGAGRRC